MTRETKIGLLVGLAFIIVIGILLSDHFASSMQPPTASLIATDQNLLQGTVTPGAPRSGGGNLPIDNVRPDRLVLFPGNPRNGAEADIRIGPGAPAGRGNITADPRAGQDNSIPPRADDTPPAPAPTREYTAEPGDTLSKIAGRLLGKNTKPNRDAIIKANPSLQRNPDKIVSGEVYLIPVKSTEITPPPSTANDAHVLLPATRPASPQVAYTTKKGDTLWRIALEQVGNPNALAQIRELNKDILKSGDTIQPNVKLRLPARQIAAAD